MTKEQRDILRDLVNRIYGEEFIYLLVRFPVRDKVHQAYNREGELEFPRHIQLVGLTHEVLDSTLLGITEVNAAEKGQQRKCFLLLL